MKDWVDLKKLLERENIPANGIELAKNFLISLPFEKRQRMMGVFTGWPEKIALFIDLLKKKRELAQNYNSELSGEILNLENQEIQNLIKKI
ncbi:MAG: hypothetical protein V1667_03390 [bacterium]